MSRCIRQEGSDNLAEVPLNFRTANFTGTASGVRLAQAFVPPIGGLDTPNYLKSLTYSFQAPLSAGETFTIRAYRYTRTLTVGGLTYQWNQPLMNAFSVNHTSPYANFAWLYDISNEITLTYQPLFSKTNTPQGLRGDFLVLAVQHFYTNSFRLQELNITAYMGSEPGTQPRFTEPAPAFEPNIEMFPPPDSI